MMGLGHVYFQPSLGVGQQNFKPKYGGGSCFCLFFFFKATPFPNPPAHPAPLSFSPVPKSNFPLYLSNPIQHLTCL